MAGKYDVSIVWINVHGGSYHKLINLQEVLQTRGLTSQVLINSDAPLGLQVGYDFEESHRESLAEIDVHIGGIDTIRQRLSDCPSRLVLFDANRTPVTDNLIKLVRDRHQAKTGDISSLLGDFSYHSTDFIFVQNLMALWFLMDYRKSRRKKRNKLARVKKIYLAGNIFYEAVKNTWTSTIDSKEAFYDKYNLDIAKPMCLWLPDREDGLHPSFRKVVDLIDSADMNVVVKLHPWEYKRFVHGYDTFGTGESSAQKWDVPLLKEEDSSWAYEFCDTAVFRGSAVGLELPFWKKPGVCIWPKEDYRTILCRDSSIRTPNVEGLVASLKSEELQSYTDADYAKSRDRVATLWKDDSFSQMADCIMDALDLPADHPTVGSAADIRKLFLGQIPWAMLKGEHYAEHLLARIFGSHRHSENAPSFVYTEKFPDFPEA